uniref:Uncharacterized protein n=1 Tax=Panagrolaimus sp. PS1159 TaxID=55785 RepID=A0AC35F274_9BILA
MAAKLLVTFCVISTFMLPYFVDALRAEIPPTKHKQFEEISYDNNFDGDDEYQVSLHQQPILPDISDDDLGYFYDFCLKLPQLEKIGKIPKNKITQTTCKKLHIILDPLFHKTTSDSKTYKWF